MCAKISVTFDDDEYCSMFAVAEYDLRTVPKEIRFIVREYLNEIGLLGYQLDENDPTDSTIE